MPVIPSLGRAGKEDKEFKVILNYTGSLRLAWATRIPFQYSQSTSNKKKKSKQVGVAAYACNPSTQEAEAGGVP